MKKFIVKSGICMAAYDNINSALAMAEKLTSHHKTESVVYQAITKLELNEDGEIKYTKIDTK
jgi:hypothetical protein